MIYNPNFEHVEFIDRIKRLIAQAKEMGRDEGFVEGFEEGWVDGYDTGWHDGFKGDD